MNSFFDRLNRKRRSLIEFQIQRRALKVNIVHAGLRWDKTYFVNAIAKRFRQFTLLPDARRQKDEHPDVRKIRFRQIRIGIGNLKTKFITLSGKSVHSL